MKKLFRGQANIMQIACAVAGSVPKFSELHMDPVISIEMLIQIRHTN